MNRMKKIFFMTPKTLSNVKKKYIILLMSAHGMENLNEDDKLAIKQLAYHHLMAK